MKISTVILIPVVALITGCSRSLVYSPSVNLPNKLLKEKEIDLSAGAELMPEARPESLGGNPVTLGIAGQAGYGFSDKFNLSVKAWIDIEERENVVRGGYSLNGQFILSDDREKRWIILPRMGIAMQGNQVSGYGVSSSLIFHKTLRERFGLYAGLGAVWGFQHLEKTINSKNREKFANGHRHHWECRHGLGILERIQDECGTVPHIPNQYI